MNQTEHIMAAPVIVRRKREKAVYGVSSSTIDRLIAQKLFPPRRSIGGCKGSLYEEGRAAIEKLARNSEEG
jgi:predicted DNA-binding transcriptional regulator AlpA